jgi:hypothetical protein
LNSRALFFCWSRGEGGTFTAHAPPRLSARAKVLFSSAIRQVESRPPAELAQEAAVERR